LGVLAVVSCFSQRVLHNKKRPTKRALDGWDSAPFLGFIFAQAESCSRSFVHACLVVEPVETHLQVTQAVGQFLAK